EQTRSLPTFFYHHRFMKRFQHEANFSRQRRISLRLWRFKNFNHPGIIKTLHNVGPNLYELKMDICRIYFAIRNGKTILLYFGLKDTQLDDVAIVSRLVKDLDDLGKVPEEIPNVLDSSFQADLDKFEHPAINQDVHTMSD